MPNVGVENFLFERLRKNTMKTLEGTRVICDCTEPEADILTDLSGLDMRLETTNKNAGREN